MILQKLLRWLTMPFREVETFRADRVVLRGPDSTPILEVGVKGVTVAARFAIPQSRNAVYSALIASKSVPPCRVCGGTGWRPNVDSNGNRVWLPFTNDAVPCECDLLARNYAAQRAQLERRGQ